MDMSFGWRGVPAGRWKACPDRRATPKRLCATIQTNGSVFVPMIIDQPTGALQLAFFAGGQTW
jgi:hypothetical protein